MMDYNLAAAQWAYGVEVSTHAVRLLVSGVFDRFPALRGESARGTDVKVTRLRQPSGLARLQHRDGLAEKARMRLLRFQGPAKGARCGGVGAVVGLRHKPGVHVFDFFQLSGERANAVAKLLQDRLRGQPVKLVIAGYGEEDPIADNSTPQGQTLNRRVMVLYKPPT